MEEAQRTYIPAAGRDWRLPLYDPMVWLLGGNAAREALIERAGLHAGQHVLDVGCGTGTLIMFITRMHPGVEVVGLDPDPKALARARRKAERAGVPVRLDRGFSDDMPYPEASFDRVFSSFMFHHLPGEQKRGTLREIRRVLKPGGSLCLLDFARPASQHGNALARWLHSHQMLDDNDERRVLAMMADAGFADPKIVGRSALLVWQTAYYQAAAPEPAA